MFTAFMLLIAPTICPCAPGTKEPCPDVRIVVFRHHPGIIVTKERMEARDRDEKAILKALEGKVGLIEYGGGLGRGYELAIHARDLGRWKVLIDDLHKAGSLKYYDHWGEDKGSGVIVFALNIAYFRSTIKQRLPTPFLPLGERSALRGGVGDAF